MTHVNSFLRLLNPSGSFNILINLWVGGTGNPQMIHLFLSPKQREVTQVCTSISAVNTFRSLQEPMVSKLSFQADGRRECHSLTSLTKVIAHHDSLLGS